MDPIRWIPGAKGRLAATADGQLVRFFKTDATGKYTDTPRYEIIKPPNSNYQVTYNERIRLAQWWICAAYHGLPENLSARVTFLDGNRSNMRPDNLAWREPSKSKAASLADAQNLTRRHLDRSKKYRPIRGVPGYYASHDGKIIRILHTGFLKHVTGTLNRTTNTAMVRLPKCLMVPYKEVIADVWLPTPRPTPYHRATLIDTSNPRNTHPENLTWETMQRRRPFEYNFRPNPAEINPAPEPYEPVSRKAKAELAMEAQQARHRSILAEADALDAAGARRLAQSLRVWITPAGRCVLLLDEGTHSPEPDAEGYIHHVPELGTLHLPSAVADAFHGTHHAPNLPDPCPMHWEVKTLDGLPNNCHPSNLTYRTSNRHTQRPFYTFKDPTP